MIDEFKKIIWKISKEISVKTLYMIADEFPEEPETSDVLNILISAHLSSLAIALSAVTEDESEEMKELIKLFMGKLLAAALSMPNIEGVNVEFE